MSKKPNYRMERIERLLTELRYEVERGMLEGEVDEHLRYQFIVPISKTYPTRGVVHCIWQTRPVENMAFLGGPVEPKLKVVK